jgi:16S rRNA (cytosine967-C5)-methyltransferase
MKNNPRYLTIQILCKRQATREPVDSIMEQLLQQADLQDSRDNQLVMAIVYGVLRWQRFLDAVLVDFSSHPLQKMKPMTLQALRVGLFQLCFMDRIPPSAAVNETVKALRSARQPKWLTGFVNGVLRAITRKQQTLPDPWKDTELPVAVRFSHPDWLYRRWKKRYGESEAISLCMTNNKQPHLCLRINTEKCGPGTFLNELEAHDISAIPGKFSPTAVILPNYKGHISALPGYSEGLFSVQDEGAQLIPYLLAPFLAGKYLDACAGLGGKTLHMANLLPDTCSLTAIEPNNNRFELLQQNIDRLNATFSITPFKGDVRTFSQNSNDLFQAILVDAPCSGLGVIRRHPDIRWNRSPEDLIKYQAIQTSLLHDASLLLAPGGTLVYATCSTEAEENEDVVDIFLKDHSEYSLDSPPEFPKSAQKLIDSRGFFHTLPTEWHDGFFAARLIRN